MPETKTYTLTGKESSFQIAPHKGGMVSSLRLNGREILYMDAEALLRDSMAVHGGIPILFPVCGTLREDTWRQDGAAFYMPKHGIARLHDWKEIHSGQAADELEATWELRSEEIGTSREYYPYDFLLRFTYQLRRDLFRVTTRVLNRSGREMPFSLGLHPYFKVSDTAAAGLDLAAASYEVFENGAIHPAAEALPVHEFPNSLIVRGLRKNRAAIREDGLPPVVISYSEHFRHLVVWSGHPGYLCLEPWTALPDALNTGFDLIRLQPSAVWEAWMEVRTSAS